MSGKVALANQLVLDVVACQLSSFAHMTARKYVKK